MNIETNKQLSSYNTLAVPSVSEFFVEIASCEELVEAVSWAKDEGVKVHVLGSGSNVILPKFINGLVIHLKIMGFEVVSKSSDEALVRVGAGENWHHLVCRSVEAKLFGVENLALIPGSCGAAPVQNIGAYGVELKDVFYSLVALDTQTLECKTFFADDCCFEYRDSVFKTQFRGRYIILQVELLLSKQPKFNISYPALKQKLNFRDGDALSSEQIKNAVVEIRTSKLPDPSKVPNSGSFFKNPIVSLEKYKQLKEAFPSVAAFDQGLHNKKIAAAWLIESAGWKGRLFRGVRVHSDHALVLTNPNGCDAKSILNAVAEIQRDVSSMFGIELEMEPQVLQ